MNIRTCVGIVLVAFLPVLALALAWRFAPPVLDSDSATGFRVWSSMSAGGPWNSIVQPSATNLAKDESFVVTWWSPGQWIVPGAIHSLGFTWGHAASLTSFLSASFGLWFTWLLARRLALTLDQTLLASLTVIAAGGVLQGYGRFIGGEILMQTAVPLLYLATLRALDHPTVGNMAGFFFACFFALFCKHSAAIAIIGALAYAAVESFGRRRWTFLCDGRIWSLGILAAVALLLSRILWVQGGSTPGDAGPTARHWVPSIAYSLNGPWFALTGTGKIMEWFAGRQGFSFDDFWHRVAPTFLFCGLASVVALTTLAFHRATTRIWRLAACATLTTSGLMATLYLRGASVSVEERHFRLAVPLLALALASTALPTDRSRNRIWSALINLLLIAAIFFGFAAHLRRVHLLAILPQSEISGFAQPNLSTSARSMVDRFLSKETTLVLTMPNHALEFPERRILASDAFFRPTEDLSHWRYAGAPPSLALAVPASFDIDGRGALLRAAFTDIAPSQWRCRDADDWHVWSIPTAGNTTRQ